MHTVSDEQKYWRSRKLYCVLKDDRVSCFCYDTSIFNLVYEKVSSLSFCYIVTCLKIYFAFRSNQMILSQARKNEEYLQYLADSNLQDTYAPTNGKILLLKSIVVISITNLFSLSIRICIQKLLHLPHFRGTFLHIVF